MRGKPLEEVVDKPYEGRLEVPAEKKPWSVPWPEYAPRRVVSPVVVANARPGGWADPAEIAAVRPRLRLAGIPLDAEGLPFNSLGRHGIGGRGLLGRWGPNAAADPILTRESRAGELELLVIVRRDNGRLALPGGMRDLDEPALAAARRELHEETGLDLELEEGGKVFDGVVAGDWRNTDNAWISTTAFHRHLGGREGEGLVPRASDDAREVRWLALAKEAVGQRNANHGEMVRLALKALRGRPELPAGIARQIDAVIGRS